MSRRPISHSPDLRRLEAEGYTLSIAGGKLVVGDVPFVDEQRTVHRDGRLVMPLTLAGDVARPPADHTASFAGGIPCDQHGSPLKKIINGRGRRDAGDGIIVDCTFSMKPLKNSGAYRNFHDKVTKYVAAIAPHAVDLDPSAKATIFRPVVPDDDDSPFHYLDTASSRAGIDAVNEKLDGERVGIVGLGGSGEYILDFVAKTRATQVDVWDGDDFLTHNAFRAPGAPTLDELNAAPRKVDHFVGIYSRMRRGIVGHPYFIDETNLDEIRACTFVFLAIDDAESKAPIIAALIEWQIPFVDVGMGIELVDGRLTGVVRTTLVTPDKSDHAGTRIATTSSGIDGDYRANIQIAELNARNASDAVVKWKKYRGVYADLEGEHFSALSIATNRVVNDDHGTRGRDEAAA